MVKVTVRRQIFYIVLTSDIHVFSYFQQRILGLKQERISKKAPKTEAVSQQKVVPPSDAATSRPRNPPTHNSSLNGPEDEGMEVDDNTTQVNDLSDDVQYSIVRKVNDNDHDSSSKNHGVKAPGSKIKRLKHLLDTADKKRQRLDDLKMSGSAGVER